MLAIRVLSSPDPQAGAEYRHPAGPFDIGRADPPAGGPARCVLKGDQFVSRDHVRLEEVAGGAVRVTNLSSKKPVLCGGARLDAGDARTLAPPFRIAVGKTWVAVDPADPEPPSDPGEFATLVPAGGRPLRLADLADTPDPATLGAWFEAVVAVHRAAPGSADFYKQTAAALVDLIGLDVGLVLLRRPPADWAVVARAAGPAADRARPGGREFSRTVLDKVARDRRTVYQAGRLDAGAESLTRVEALVAAPVVGPGDEVVGAVYGTRWQAGFSPGREVGPLEAQMVQVLATAVGAGLARAEHEAEAARLRVQFRQYFSDQLARELELNAGRLDGQDREVTLLFADVRGFTGLSERLGPADTFRLVSAVMGALSEAVHAHDGVVMDYVGDELIAMWNAPVDVPDHPRRAAECAAGFAAALAPVNAAWGPKLPHPVAVGVGLNTGAARVGNTGTRYKFKYGALGHHVNLASRIQGATKAFGVGVLAAAATRGRLPAGAPARRVGRVRVVGVAEPVELFELAADPGPAWEAARAGYEAALARFEAGDLPGAAAGLRGLSDGPARLLAGRVADLLRPGAGPADGVIELTTK